MDAPTLPAPAPSENGAAGAAAYPLKATLGQHTYGIYPQRHARLNNQLGQWMDSLQNLDSVEGVTGLDDVLGLLGDRSYALLKVFIPDLMPEYEYRGFATQQAMEAGEYEEQYDHSPSYPEVFDAFQTCMKVNRLDLLKQLGKAIDPRVIRAYITQTVGTFLSQRTFASSSADDTAGPPITSGTSAPTSEESTASPSLDSTASSPQPSGVSS